MSKANETGAPLPEVGATSQAGPQRTGAATRPRSPRNSGKSRTARKGLTAAAILGFSAALGRGGDGRRRRLALGGVPALCVPRRR